MKLKIYKRKKKLKIIVSVNSAMDGKEGKDKWCVDTYLESSYQAKQHGWRSLWVTRVKIISWSFSISHHVIFMLNSTLTSKKFKKFSRRYFFITKCSIKCHFQLINSRVIIACNLLTPLFSHACIPFNRFLSSCVLSREEAETWNEKKKKNEEAKCQIKCQQKSAKVNGDIKVESWKL
jgi:hypothetical protein